MSDIFELESKGIDVRSGITYAGGEERYISTLSMYRSSYENMAGKLKDLCKEGNSADFSVTVHALKSSSKLIGAEDVFRLAEDLEKRSADGDMISVANDLPGLLEMYKNTVETIEPYAVQTSGHENVDLIGKNEAIRLLKMTETAFDEFDDISALEYLRALNGFLFDTKLKSKFDYLMECAEEFVYDEGLKTVREMLADME